MYDLAIVNGKVYSNGVFEDVHIYITDEKITTISSALLDAKTTYDAKGHLVLPGIIDPHTHFELDLGFIKSKDDFESGSKAAAYGGVTTIIDFLDPVNTPDDLEKAYLKRNKQAAKSVIDYKFHACLKNPKNMVIPITKKMKELGLNTVKVFTTYSDSNRRTHDAELLQLLEQSHKQDFLVTAHIENDDLIVTNQTDTYDKLPGNRPTISEITEAIKLANYVKETHGHLYMVHLSSGDTLRVLKKRYPEIINKHFYIESCPHYFVFNNKVINNDDGFLYTMAPPLRSEMERKMLSILIDDVYTIGTDHCSFNKADKKQQTLAATPLGIGGIEQSFPIMYTLFGDKIIDKMTSNVAKVHKLYPQKGVIQIGSDADLFIYKLARRKLTEFHGGSDYSVYQDLDVNGEVLTTISRGKFIVKDKHFVGGKGTNLHMGGNENEST